MTNMMAPDPKECERAMALSPAAQRWRAVDSAFQAAIACERSRRDLIVAEACGQDADVRREVESLLDAHDRAADDFLERPAAASFAAALTSPRSAPRSAPSPAPERRRAVSARAALFMAGAMLTVGLVGGWQLAGSASAVARLTSSASELLRPPANADVDAMWPSAADGALALTVVDRAGRSAGRGTIAANRPWTPRFSPDGRRLAYGAFGPERSSSDVWVTDLDAGTTRRLTNDSRDNNDPQWNADGRTLAYSASAAGGKDVLMQAADGGAATVIVARDGTQFPSDWLRDGSALLVTHANGSSNDILAQPLDGSAAWPYAATSANETAARASPDGKWVAYTSDESGRVEVYLDSYPRPGKRIAISQDGGMHPVWRGDGRELFYWSNDALIAVQIGMPPDGSPPAIERRTLLFRAPYQVGLNTMYDVSPDGRSFVIVRNGDAMR